MMNRRILSELRKDWPEGISRDNLAIIDNHYQIYHDLENKILPNELNIYIINETYNKTFLVTLDFLHLNTYPFKPPKVKINRNYEYLCLVAHIPERLVKEVFGLTCLCCQSILCNWGPSFSLLDIIKECQERIELKFRSQNIKAAELCVIKKFGHYLPIAEFL